MVGGSPPNHSAGLRCLHHAQGHALITAISKNVACRYANAFSYRGKFMGRVAGSLRDPSAAEVRSWSKEERTEVPLGAFGNFVNAVSGGEGEGSLFHRRGLAASAPSCSARQKPPWAPGPKIGASGLGSRGVLAP